MSSPISSGHVPNLRPKTTPPPASEVAASPESSPSSNGATGLEGAARDSVAIGRGESSSLTLESIPVPDDYATQTPEPPIAIDDFGSLLDTPEIAVDDFDPDSRVPEIAVDDFDAIRTDAITGMYQELLGRDPEAEGLKFWFDSDFSLDEIKERIANSPERQTKIDEMYQELLGREAEEEGLKFWAGSGLSLDEVREGIANSPERRTKAITEMYEEILGREPEAEGLKYWFDSGLSLDEIKAEIANSPEAAERTQILSEREKGITQIYQELLGEDPDPEDLKLWAESSYTLDEIRTIIASSLEDGAPDVAGLLQGDRR